MDHSGGYRDLSGSQPGREVAAVAQERQGRPGGRCSFVTSEKAET